MTAVDNETRESRPPAQRRSSLNGHAKHQCSDCSRSFDRRDTLSRHMQIHCKARSQPQSRRKACIPCCKSKIRCSTEHPSCRACQKRSINCVYDKASRTFQEASSHTRSAIDTPKNRDTREGDNRVQNISGGVIEHGLPSPTNATDPVQPSRTDWHLNPSQPSPGSSSERANSHAINFFATDDSMIFDSTDFNSNLGLMFDENFGQFVPDAFEFPIPGNINSPSAIQTSLITGDSFAVAAQGQNDGRDCSVERIPDINTSAPPERSSSGQPWLRLTGWLSDLANSQLVLPALGKNCPKMTSQPRYFATTPVTHATCVALQELLKLPFERSPWQSLEVEDFPSNHMLDYCIDHYFANFNQMLPVVHQPTFDPAQDLLVTLTMVCIGAAYAGMPDSRPFSITLSELIHRLLSLMIEHDPRQARTETYMTTQLLQGVFGYSSGSEKLFELSESCRSALVHQAKCTGLLRFEVPVTATNETRSSQDMWLQWIRKERSRRLGWAIYEFDASTAYIHNNRPFLSTGDINIPLPSSSQHWEAPSAQAWSRLHVWPTQYPCTPVLRPLIRSFFNGTKNPLEKITEGKHRYYVLLTLVRILWSFKELKSSPISDIVPDGLDAGRRQVLRAIDGFDESRQLHLLSKIHTRHEMVRIAHCAKLVHVAYLHGAGDLMNWLYPSLQNGVEAENARHRMLQWASEEPRRVRQVAYRCAQILALARQYPSNMPLEPSIIFHAGVVLWYMARLLSSGSTVSGEIHSNSDLGLTYIRLDHLGSPEDGVFPEVQSWIRNGGPNIVGLHGVPSLCCYEGRQQVLEQVVEMLRYERLWAIAQNFARVLLSLRDEGSNKFDSAPIASSFQVLVSTLSPTTHPRGS